MKVLSTYLTVGAAVGIIGCRKKMRGRNAVLTGTIISMGFAVLAMASNYWENAERIASMPVFQAVALFAACVLLLGGFIAVPVIAVLFNLSSSLKEKRSQS